MASAVNTFMRTYLAALLLITFQVNALCSASAQSENPTKPAQERIVDTPLDAGLVPAFCEKNRTSLELVVHSSALLSFHPERRTPPASLEYPAPGRQTGSNRYLVYTQTTASDL